MYNITEDSFSKIYEKLLNCIYYSPDFSESPRGLKVKEKMNVEFILTNPLNNLYENKIRSPKLNYLYPELLYYFRGNNDLEFISKYSKFWKNIANFNSTLNSAYGNLIFTQKNKYNITEWEWAYKSLVKDKYSRQALIRFNKPIHSRFDVKDFPCTLNGLFYIRDNKLNFKITMRSQDVWFGIIYDVPFFTLLQQQMLNHLLPIYPELKLGDYIHHTYNIHMYEKNFKDIENMLNNKFINDSIPKLKNNLIENNGKYTNILYLIYHVINYNTPKNHKQILEDLTNNYYKTDKLLYNLYTHSIKK